MICMWQKQKLFYLARMIWFVLDLRWAIPKGFCGRIFPHSSLIKDNNVTVEAGLIDADYRGLIYVLLFNHSQKSAHSANG